MLRCYNLKYIALNVEAICSDDYLSNKSRFSSIDAEQIYNITVYKNIVFNLELA